MNNAHTFTETQSKAVEILNLHKRFGTLEVLRDINFTVAAGEIVALVGTSGCGKSTLLNIVSGLLGHDAGFVRIDGHTAKDFDGWQRLSYMFQEDRLLPWRSVRDNVAFGLVEQGLRSAQARLQAHHGCGQAGRLHRFHQIVDRSVLKSLHRVLVVGGDEDDVRAAGDLLGHVEPGHAQVDVK